MLYAPVSGHHKGPRFIARDWVGIKPPIDAAMVGRLYLNSIASSSPSPSLSPSVAPGRRGRTRGRTRGGRRRKGRGRGSRISRSTYWDDFGLDYEERYVLFIFFFIMIDLSVLGGEIRPVHMLQSLHYHSILF